MFKRLYLKFLNWLGIATNGEVAEIEGFEIGDSALVPACPMSKGESYTSCSYYLALSDGQYCNAEGCNKRKRPRHV